ncbi:AraC family transcriptional activator of pobA [Pararhizobium capsulatum DSM 1112]|uniref:AraC family transcriptional activator of pobA n=1 Tax=Pararhizobium capsulatum DSM 1112 TaxID=1121113 RepID=A0ABU0BVS7_9HYPH|nr:helix-turn-helix domain-containing protein [Pararhizobium capsulatum]MDQ0322354.1 AraC family transcriptional activator of pobA [Pararhizobium capsulatum DSM 1112]
MPNNLHPVPAIPTYDLYGEEIRPSSEFWLHCETIPSRSSLHRWEISEHRHRSFFQILYIAAGSGDAVFGGKAYALSPGTIVTVPPDARHGFRFSSDIDGFVFTILVSHLQMGPSGRNTFAAWLSEPRVTALTESVDGSYIEETLRRLADAASQRHAPAELCAAYLTTVLRLAAGMHADNGNQSCAGENERRMERLAELIHQHFRDHKPASFYAAAIGLSPTHLNRIVKAATGRSTHMLIEEKLLQEAKRELLFTRLPVQAIGYRLGFSDPAYFSRFFLQHAGMPPLQWRRTNAVAT